MERYVQPGEFYRHFKNKMYQIITVASHSETGELMVVYQALYGTFAVYVRPLAMFLSKVDHERYPEYKQIYRFEKVELTETEGAINPETPAQDADEESPRHLGESDVQQADAMANPYLLRFLDAGTIAGQLMVLDEMKGHVRTAELDSICHILEIANVPGSTEEQLEAIRTVLRTKQRYDGSRLRD